MLSNHILRVSNAHGNRLAITIASGRSTNHVGGDIFKVVAIDMQLFGHQGIIKLGFNKTAHYFTAIHLIHIFIFKEVIGNNNALTGLGGNNG